MQSVTDEFNYTLKLERGERVVEKLTRFVRDNNLRGGWVLGLGGLAWAEIGFYDLDAQEYSWSKIEETLELANLTGNIAWDGDEPALHLHATVSDASLHARAGHLKEAEVGGTVEIFIHMWDKEDGFARRRDEQTGLNLLNL